MPFGLCSAPATFQHLMEQVLYDVNNKICTIYLDYILIWSSTVEEHLERLWRKSLRDMLMLDSN